MSPLGYRLLADLVLTGHALFAVFVAATPVLVLAGAWRGGQWVRNPWLRWIHLAAVAVVVTQSWLGLICPLTNLEMWLRERAGDAAYAGSFIAYWLHRALYYQLPDWMFTVLYTAFGALVLWTWHRVPPRPVRGPPE